MSNAAYRMFAGAIVGIIIRYGLDAKKHLFVLDCWHNVSQSPESELPTSVVINYNSTEYFEYTNGRKVDKDYVGQPQFENKVLAIAMVLFLQVICIMCDYYYLLQSSLVMILVIYVYADSAVI